MGVSYKKVPSSINASRVVLHAAQIRQGANREKKDGRIKWSIYCTVQHCYSWGGNDSGSYLYIKMLKGRH